MTTYPFKRSLLNRIFGGVAGGIGDYLGISGWWIRAVFLAVVLTNFSFGILLYLLLWFLIPAQSLNDVPIIPLPEEIPAPRYTRPEGVLFIGALAIIIGIVILAETTGVLLVGGGDLLPPGMLVVIGIVVLLKHLRGVS
ncbi:MAG: PspC domain-containing protein [Anaerolineae bacterium]|nr:PspC domain-containing protein [Anaerolineae bacterium]